MKNEGSIYAWLEEVRKRPGMFVTDGNNLADLETLIWGYHMALKQHGIIEKGPKFETRDFIQWLHVQTGTGGALGWSNILNEKYPNPELAFQKFWEYIEEYKNFKN